MSYRRYPNRERAQSQLDRHYRPAPPSELQLKLAQEVGRTLRPFHDAMRQVAVAAPALLAQSAPGAYKFIEALKQQARTT